MSRSRLLCALLPLVSCAAFAAPAAYMTLDHSSAQLMDAATASGLWKQSIKARLFKLYPVKNWGFVSEVEGGFDDARVCVITARAMMLPRSGKALVFRPAKTATAFGARPGATADQCRALGKEKLSVAIGAVTASLAASN